MIYVPIVTARAITIAVPCWDMSFTRVLNRLEKIITLTYLAFINYQLQNNVDLFCNCIDILGHRSTNLHELFPSPISKQRVLDYICACQ